VFILSPAITFISFPAPTLPVLLRTSKELLSGGGCNPLFCKTPGAVVRTAVTLMGCPVALSHTLFWLFASALPDAPSKESMV
jgi:hypothetical protein